MGKKGGKKGKLEKGLETVEENLPTIVEEQEQIPDEKPEPTVAPTDPTSMDATEISIDTEQHSQTTAESKSILKVRTDSLLRKASIKRKSQSVVVFEDGKNAEDIDQVEELTDEPQMPDEIQEFEEKTKKGKKGKKGKKEQINLDDSEVAEQDKPKKGKKSKKGKTEDTVEEDEAEEVPPKKAKKGKKGKPEKLEEPPTMEMATETEETLEEIRPTKKGKKAKKAKAEEVVETGIIAEEENGEIEEDVAETEKKQKKDKKDKLKKGRKSVEIGGTEVRRSSKGSDKSDKSPEVDKSVESLTKRRKSKGGSEKRMRASKTEMEDENGDAADKRRRISSRVFSGTKRTSMAARKARASTTSSESSMSADIDLQRLNEIAMKARGKKKGKKGKKAKEEPEEVGEEERERRRIVAEEEKARKKAERDAEKKAKRAAKKEAKKAERKEAEEKRKAEKGEKDEDVLKKKIDELKKEAKEMGISESKIALTQGEDDIKGPKKKVSKKEKAKMTAEMAEKAKAEMEAHAKRLEELLKKKKEEERLAAIEKDKKEILDQESRVEQLEETNDIIRDITFFSTEIARKERELLEWNKYIECGRLPNPALVDQMNTYLHLWQLDLVNTSMDDASSRTADSIQLLNDLEELMDTITEDDYHKLENWKWIRQLFREYQAASLDVATYRLLRDVEHNLNRINIPTADFNYQSEHVTLCLWLRVMLPIPLPNPRRPPKPRIEVSFNLMNLSVLFPITIDCENAAIRAMYLKYDHLSDLCFTFNMPEVPPDYYMDLLSICKKEWRTRLQYKYNNRDRIAKLISLGTTVVPNPQENGDEPAVENVESVEPQTQTEKLEDKRITFEGVDEDFGPEDEIPIVPFKQLQPTASEHAAFVEDELYADTRNKILLAAPETVINLRKFVILGGVFHLNLLAQPPQPQDFVTMEMTITALYLPKMLEMIPFQVVYTPYIPPPDPEPSESNTSLRKLPEELEEEQKKQEDELDKLILINIKWPQHVIFLELPVVCRWDEENLQWSNEEIHDVKHNEDKCMLSFRTGVFGIYALATYRYSNLPFQAYDIKPEVDNSVTVQLTAAILMLEFNVKDGLIAITQLQNSPNMTLQDVIGKYMELHKLKRMMLDSGIDIFPAFDSFCYVDGSCEKQWAMEKHLYYNMALISNSFNFAWSRWNQQAGRRKIIVQMRHYLPEKGKQKPHQMLMVSPLQASFIDCTEVSQAFSDKEVEGLKFCADLWHLMTITSGIFIKNKVKKASKQTVYTLAQFLITTRILSFS